MFAEIKITCDFFSFKDDPFSILKFVRLATHAEFCRPPYLLIVGLVLFPPPLSSFSSSRLLFLLALLKKCLSLNGMFGFVVFSNAWSWKADWELLGHEDRTDICTQESLGASGLCVP